MSNLTRPKSHFLVLGIPDGEGFFTYGSEQWWHITKILDDLRKKLGDDLWVGMLSVVEPATWGIYSPPPNSKEPIPGHAIEEGLTGLDYLADEQENEGHTVFDQPSLN